MIFKGFHLILANSHLSNKRVVLRIVFLDFAPPRGFYLVILQLLRPCLFPPPHKLFLQLLHPHFVYSFLLD